MQTITLTLPDGVQLQPGEAQLLLASHLYEQGRLALGDAAEVAGLSKRAFAEILGKYGVSLFNHPPADLLADVAHA